MTELNKPTSSTDMPQKTQEENPVSINRDSYWDLPPASISLPKKGSAGKTGNWRVYRPVVNHENCIHCYFCYMYCPEGVISVNENTKDVEIDYDYCKGCGVCANNCPKKCITMEKESK